MELAVHPAPPGLRLVLGRGMQLVPVVTVRQIIIAIGILLIVGFILSLRAPVAGLYPVRAIPVPGNDWKWLNGE